MDRRALMLATGGLLGGAGAAQLAAAGTAAAAPAAAAGPVFDVRAYGAVGDGVADDTAAFRSALTDARAVAGGGATLRVPPGSYPLGESLLLGPGMTVQAYGARLFRTGNTSALIKNYTSGMPAVAGYGGAGNISVFGGTWDMRGSRFTSTCPAFVFTHADGFTIRDATVLDVPQAHAIELNAVRRARIVDCLFDGVYAGTGTPTVPNRLEAVQITGATNAANLPAPDFDGTPCEDVLITGCVMRNSRPDVDSPYDALCGDHYVASADGHRPLHRNIRVLANRVESSGAYGIRATDWQQSVIADNTIDSAAVNGIYVSSGSGNALQDIAITGNTIRGAGSGGIVVSNSGAGRNSSVAISGNLIRATNGETAIYVSQTDGATITGNIVATTRHPSGGNCQGIQVQRSPHAVITGNHLSDIAGDGIGVDTGSTEALIAQNTVLGATHNGISVASSEAAVRDNRITGAGTGAPDGNYAIRIGGNAVNVSVRGNVARVGEGGVAEAGVGVMAGSQAAWITGNDLRGWGTAVRDRGAGTVGDGNLG
ncbi:right-handed parallel beta-helix repeat-containing protein [Streptomyces sp. NBC_01116]|uniref:right-handed parallel beta-helix repeat-containing protein n=1 Tax=Streptomyces sp. NBC_01116 TaxID=2903752 RepID=UPI0032547EB7